MTQSIKFSNKFVANANAVELNLEGGLTQAGINARVYDNAVDTIICDDLMIVRENGQTTVSVMEGSILSGVLGGMVKNFFAAAPNTPRRKNHNAFEAIR
ncbi:hypothetical protein HKI87_04g29550 [Chloropicon roscoffensis]|uniref:Uncharacterized protein n=1 Tax=Chloropicon roscoffensis TaxID=1461544 RepID=A0AAX4P4T8_9CHLO